MNNPEGNRWRFCTTCKNAIPFGGKYWVCSVSTCNRKNTDYAFCSVNCWDAHVPIMRHRNAWAEEKRAPTREEWEQKKAQEKEEVERQRERAAERDEGVKRSEVEARMSKTEDTAPEEVLIVVSRLKKYVKCRSELKTSDGVMDVLSDIIRDVMDEAILRAATAGRSTVLDRDVQKIHPVF